MYSMCQCKERVKVAHIAHNDWASIVTGWTPTGKIKGGRPKTRWVDDIRSLNNNWMSSAQDRKKWSDQKEASI